MTAGETTGARQDTATPPARRSAAKLPAEHVDTAPGTGWPDRQALEGPFNTRQLVRLDEALRIADNSTGLTFSVYVGELSEPSRPAAEQLLAQLPDPKQSVLLAVSPNQRMLEIVTGALARRRLADRDCRLAADSMKASFLEGDLAGGIISGLAQLAERARL